MSNLSVRSITGKDGQPVAFPTGISFGNPSYGPINNIGLAGGQGFGVGICPGPLPAGMAGLSGYSDPASDNYGNYQYSDGSVMVWIPAFYYKYGTGANGLAVNVVSIKAFSAYAAVATANAAGYALHRAFYDGGVAAGVFVDKYIPSNNGGIASSLNNGKPLTSAAAHNPFSGLTGAPANFYYGAVAVAKTRGANFFPNSRFIQAALALLALAHAQASTSTAWNAWYDAAGVANFPKGCNNNAFGDYNDAALTFVWDGYAATKSCKTGSANLFARTTHNGQNCGVADLNGCLWEVSLGLTTDDAGTTYYTLKTSVRMKDVTGGTGGATDAWGAAGLAALYDSLGATYGAMTASGTNKVFGAAAQVLSEATSGLAWQAAGAGVPLVGGVGGTNAYGNDYMYDARPAAMCPVVGGTWNDGANAGVWALFLSAVRGLSDDSVGCRAALYL
jgi:hypothetical protein